MPGSGKARDLLNKNQVVPGSAFVHVFSCTALNNDTSKWQAQANQEYVPLSNNVFMYNKDKFWTLAGGQKSFFRKLYIVYLHRQANNNFLLSPLLSAPVKRPSGDGEVVLAVTQRRENMSINRHASSASAAPVITTTNLTTSPSITSISGHTDQITQPNPSQLHRPTYLTRHQSFITATNQSGRPGPGFFRGSAGGSDLTSPFVSNLSSLQSLLMSSQVAVFNSSSERLSFSSQNQNPLPFQPISTPCPHQISNSSPYSVSPAVSNSSFPQPSYFDERPPSYQESMLLRKLRASSRSTGSRILNHHHPHHLNLQSNLNYHSPLSSTSSIPVGGSAQGDNENRPNYSRSFRM